MDRIVFAEHYDRLAVIVATIHKVSAWIAVLSFAGYGVAAWVWFKGYTFSGLMIAITAYLLFRLFRKISLSVTRAKLVSRPGYADTFALLDREMTQRKPQVVLAEIEALFGETRESAKHD